MVLWGVTKTCRRCDETKPVDEFYAWPSGTRKANCKPCDKILRAEHYANNDGVDQSYEQVLKREYGITLEDYNALLRKQAHRCAICRRGETAKSRGKVRRLAVDHDHVTGAVRGLLCHRCNILVWALEDNHTTLRSVESYIDTFRETFANGAPI